MHPKCSTLPTIGTTHKHRWLGILKFICCCYKNAVALCISIHHNLLTRSRHYLNSYTPRLRNNALHHPLQRNPRQPGLRPLDLRNLIHMLQTHRPHVPNACVAWLTAWIRGLAHACSAQSRTWTSGVAGTFQLALDWSYAGCGEQEGCGGWCSEFEGEGAVGSDCHAGWNGCARDVCCCSRVEFLDCILGMRGLV